MDQKLEQYRKSGEADALWYNLDNPLTLEEFRQQAEWYSRAAERSLSPEVTAYCKGFALQMRRAASCREFTERELRGMAMHEGAL